MTDKYKILEKKYFQSDSNREEKILELEKILDKKQEEKNKLRKILDIYQYRDLEDIKYKDLLEYKKKVTLSLDLIKNRKNKSIFFKF